MKKIYIAASWKHEHAVEMLTALLRQKGHEVLSFVENNHGEGHGAELGVEGVPLYPGTKHSTASKRRNS